MFKEQNFCHIASNNRNNVKVGVFVYRTSDDLATVTVSGYFNERIIDINLHDIIIHEKIDPVDSTVVQRNTLCVVKRTVDNVKTKEIHSAWEELTDQAIQDIQNALANIALNDLTDVNINNVQVGDYLRWNGAEWINMAGGGGGSAVWGSVGGNIADQADLQAALSDKANVDLDNLSATGQAKFDAKANVDMDNLTSVGQNIANWSSNVTNCITEIPQDIKLELNAGTLTLKAGSKVYVPNGVGVFDEITIASDISFTMTWGGGTKRLLFVTNNGTALEERQYSFSGGTAPTSEQYSVWYDTTNNAVKYTSDSGSTWSSNCSFPIAIIGNTNNVTTSIDQVFNGFGYIGSTVFALPGVKGLIPNGRNADGTLNNTPFQTTNVLVYTNTVNYTGNLYILLKSNGITCWMERQNDYAICGSVYYNSGSVKIFHPKTVFRAFDYNDLLIMTFDTLYPVGSIYIGTQGTCPLATLIPGSTWTAVQGRYLLASGTLAGTSETYSATNTVAAGLPDIGGYVQAARRGSSQTSSGALYWGGSASAKAGDAGGNVSWSDSLTFWADRYNSVYGSSTTNRPAAYVVNVWRRTA